MFLVVVVKGDQEEWEKECFSVEVKNSPTCLILNTLVFYSLLSPFGSDRNLIRLFDLCF